MNALKLELKQLIVEECEADIDPAELTDEQLIVRGELDLDSIDALQICMAIKSRYGVRIEGSAAARKILKNINTLADHVAAHRVK